MPAAPAGVPGFGAVAYLRFKNAVSGILLEKSDSQSGCPDGKDHSLWLASSMPSKHEGRNEQRLGGTPLCLQLEWLVLQGCDSTMMISRRRNTMWSTKLPSRPMMSCPNRFREKKACKPENHGVILRRKGSSHLASSIPSHHGKNVSDHLNKASSRAL